MADRWRARVQCLRGNSEGERGLARGGAGGEGRGGRPGHLIHARRARGRPTARGSDRDGRYSARKTMP